LIVHWDKNQYDDRAELTDYLWHNYVALFSVQELLAAKTLMAEEKANFTKSKGVRKLLLSRWSARGNSEIDQLLADGPEKFRERAAGRVLAMHGDTIYVNRCELCSRVVATPEARQCLWCGNDWPSR
jgi:hypothetical protein